MKTSLIDGMHEEEEKKKNEQTKKMCVCVYEISDEHARKREEGRGKDVGGQGCEENGNT